MSSLARYTAVVCCLFEVIRLMEGASVLKLNGTFGIIGRTSTFHCEDAAYNATQWFIFKKNGVFVLPQFDKFSTTSKYSGTRNAGFIEININNTSIGDEDIYTCATESAGESAAYSFQVEKRFSDVKGTISTEDGDCTKKRIIIVFDGLYPSPTATTVKDGAKVLAGTQAIKTDGQFFNFEWTSSYRFSKGLHTFTVQGTTRTTFSDTFQIAITDACNSSTNSSTNDELIVRVTVGVLLCSSGIFALLLICVIINRSYTEYGKQLWKLFTKDPSKEEVKKAAIALYQLMKIATFFVPIIELVFVCICVWCKRPPQSEPNSEELPHGQRTGHSDAEHGNAPESTRRKDKHQAALIDKSSSKVHEQPSDSGADSRTDIELTDANKGQDEPIKRPQPPPPLPGIGKSHNDKGIAEPHHTNTGVGPLTMMTQI